MDEVVNQHDPETLRAMSNAGHVVEGAILTAAGVAALSDVLRGRDESAAAGSLMAGAGALLGVGLVGGSLHHGGPRRFFAADAQQRQHLQMAALVAAGGLARRRGRLGRVVADGAVARIGQVFLTHEQHGTAAAAAAAHRAHTRLGATVVAGAALAAIADVTGRRSLRAAAAIVTTAAGVQLLAYREPPEAYEHEAADGTRA